MKTMLAGCAVAVAMAVPAPAHAQPAATPAYTQNRPVRLNTQGLPSYLRERLEREAARGIQYLRWYVQRTRAIHGLDMRTLLDVREGQ